MKHTAVRHIAPGLAAGTTVAEHSHTIQAPDFVMIISINQCVPSLQRTAPCCNATPHVATVPATHRAMLQRRTPSCNAAHTLVRSAPFVALPSRRGVRCMRAACAGCILRATHAPAHGEASRSHDACSSQPAVRACCTYLVRQGRSLKWDGVLLAWPATRRRGISLMRRFLREDMRCIGARGGHTALGCSAAVATRARARVCVCARAEPCCTVRRTTGAGSTMGTHRVLRGTLGTHRVLRGTMGTHRVLHREAHHGAAGST
jgi:hypothetical protein